MLEHTSVNRITSSHFLHVFFLKLFLQKGPRHQRYSKKTRINLVFDLSKYFLYTNKVYVELYITTKKVCAISSFFILR